MKFRRLVSFWSIYNSFRSLSLSLSSLASSWNSAFFSLLGKKITDFQFNNNMNLSKFIFPTKTTQTSLYSVPSFLKILIFPNYLLSQVYLVPCYLHLSVLRKKNTAIKKEVTEENLETLSYSVTRQGLNLVPSKYKSQWLKAFCLTCNDDEIFS